MTKSTSAGNKPAYIAYHVRENTHLIQRHFQSLEPADAIWSEELIKERKEEAARESGGS